MSRNLVYIIVAIAVLLAGVMSYAVFGLGVHIRVQNTEQVPMDPENDEAKAVKAIEEMGGSVEFETNKSGAREARVYLRDVTVAGLMSLRAIGRIRSLRF